MKVGKTVFGLIGLIGLIAQPLPTLAADQALPEMVVSATRTEKLAEEAPASVSVISREEIERQNIRTVDEVLRYETGVQVKRCKGVAEATPRVQLRGLYGQDRTLILVDGLPANDGYSAGAPLSQVGIDNIERIEIIRGPASALYGGHALGGVINIITRRPEKFEGRVHVGGGSDDSWRLGASIGGRISDSFALRIGAEREETDGYPAAEVQRPLTAGAGTLSGGSPTTTTSGAPRWVVGDKGDNWGKRENINLQGVLDPADGTRLILGVQHGVQEYGYGRPHTYLTDAGGNPAFSGSVDVGGGQRATVSPSNYIYYNGNGHEAVTLTSLTWEQEAGDWQLETKAGYQQVDKWYTSATASGAEDYDTSDGTLSDATTQAYLLEFQASRPLGEDHLATGGLSFRQNRFDQDKWTVAFYRDEDSKIAKTTITEGKDRFYGIFLQDEWRFAPAWTLYLGARYDFWQAFDGRSGNVGSETDFSEPSDSAISPKAALVWQAAADTTVRASAGRAFRPPTIYELYSSWQSGSTLYHSNPDLDPETLWNLELGAEQHLWARRVRLAGTVFYSRLQDAIESYAVGSDKYTDNVSEAEIRGIELELELRPVDKLRLWANASFTDSEVLENEANPATEGNKLTDVAARLFNVGAEYAFPWLRLAVDGNYQGRIHTSALNDDVTGVYGSYDKRWLWNAKATVPVGKHLELSASVENLLDEDYYDYYIGRGRSYFVELTGKF